MSVFGKIIDSVRMTRWEKAQYKAKNASAHEWLAQNPQPELTKDEIKEIDEYWAKYGIKFKDYCWFQWYYGISGIKSPRFIPNDVYAYIVWPYYDNEGFRHAWKDKNFFERFLPDVTFPNTILRRIHGRFYDSAGSFISDNDIEAITKILVPRKEVIVKDAWDTGEGRGVTKYHIKNENDVKAMLKDWSSDNFLVQEVIKQHQFFAQFNESSVNMLRINSWFHDGKVEIVSPVLRMGMPGFATDVCFIDGVEIVRAVGITLDGHLRRDIVALDGKKQPVNEVIENPDEKVPCWDEIIRIIKENAVKLPHFDVIGWDFTVTTDEKPVCIEYNIQRPSTVLCQPNNGPFFEEYTDNVLDFLRDDKNQEKYIPKWLRR
ncbi:MAG: sugar-transfer associated ATP-grasp domain-containing protein [Eubacterium sp.]